MKKFIPLLSLLAPMTAMAEGVEEWQLGFGLGVEQYREEYIDSASIRGDERIVTTEKTYETRPSAWLTMNWNIWGIGPTTKSGDSGNDVNNIKWGFFAGMKLIDADSSAFSSFALGPQVSFQTENKRTISVGFGWVTHETKTYANGIIAGAPLPSQYDDITFEEGTENSYMLMMSVGF
ncbi:hypothetical protein J8M21_20735 [Pseudoalteromonas luteoviolacea]|uniref:hypothetical protein n=1 Tax=Pseudoalteromonas luteoviolacea TaxID=43657 RepID=UPI001B3A6D20|nr:hypothetical protein [Pseudoalteromonas luteoviolacea]MBQ4879648.1 hypothetical protein [Pseudoalteromonas luteoviolacea]MBQ4909178.1 hypothetical protein [Pseudoalteromonas luteoviolacea]